MLSSRNGVGWTYWSVPVGYRAVIKSVTALSPIEVGFQAVVNIADWTAYMHLFLAQRPIDIAPMMVVAYGGEQISAYCYGEYSSTTVYGYLFADPTHRTGPLEGASLLPQGPAGGGGYDPADVGLDPDRAG